MPRPNHGALGLSLIACRALQFVCLIVAMSVTARIISVMIDNDQQPPEPVIGILSILCFAILYTVISVILYWDRQLPMLPTAIIDALFFIALMVSSIVLGKPLSYISCKDRSNTVFTTTPAPVAQESWVAAPVAADPPTTTTITYVTETVKNAVIAATVAPGGTAQVYGTDGQLYSISAASRMVRRQSEESAMEKIVYGTWIRNASTNTCMMMKAVWGLGIALTVLFVFSVACIVFIWKQERTPRLPAKTVDDE